MKEVVLNELNLLHSMYSAEQIRYNDPEVTAMMESISSSDDTEEAIAQSASSEGTSFSFVLKLEDVFELLLRLSSDYPESKKSISVNVCGARDHLSANAVKQMDIELADFIQSQEECNIIAIINQFNDIKRKVAEGDLKFQTKSIEQDSGSLKKTRIWIYSHHIYNKHKRKFLVDTAQQLQLAGFSMSGKPGFVCVEGTEEDCDDYWAQVRKLTWQKISLILKETSVDPCFIGKFEELRLNKSDFIKYLDERNKASVIRDYLGI